MSTIGYKHCVILDENEEVIATVSMPEGMIDAFVKANYRGKTRKDVDAGTRETVANSHREWAFSRGEGKLVRRPAHPGNPNPPKEKP